jgi:hypothetical protein
MLHLREARLSYWLREEIGNGRRLVVLEDNLRLLSPLCTMSADFQNRMKTFRAATDPMGNGRAKKVAAENIYRQPHRSCGSHFICGRA